MVCNSIANLIADVPPPPPPYHRRLVNKRGGPSAEDGNSIGLLCILLLSCAILSKYFACRKAHSGGMKLNNRS